MKTRDLRWFLDIPRERTVEVFPVYSDGISMKYQKHDGDEFHLPSFSTALRFTRQDYEVIARQSLGTEMTLRLEIQDGDDDILFESFRFKKIDGTIDPVAKVFTVTPKPVSLYDKVLAKLDEEVDLFHLSTAPAIEQVQTKIRPVVQCYIENTSTVGNWMGAVHWETPVQGWEDLYFGSDNTDPNNVLNVNRYGFVWDLYLSHHVYTISFLGGDPSPSPLGVANTYVAGNLAGGSGIGPVGGFMQEGEFPMDNGFVLVVRPSGPGYRLSIVDSSNAREYWAGTVSSSAIPAHGSFSVSLSAQTGASPSYCTLYFQQLNVATRCIANVHPVIDSNNVSWGTLAPGTSGTGSFWGNLIDEDPFIDYKNYKFFIQYAVPADFATISGAKTSAPTPYGLWQPGIYYAPVAHYKPMATSSWGDWSLWYEESGSDPAIDSSGSVVSVLRHTYPLWSVLSVLLTELVPGIVFDKEDFSEFFGPARDPNHLDPVANYALNIFFVPATNVLVGNYDQPAQKAKITLGKVLDALKKVFSAYWCIDDNGKFRVEHISWFENGGSYSGSPDTLVDLTEYENVRVSKPWSFAQDEQSYDTDKLWSKISYPWPENASDPFIGHPILMGSDYVDPELTDERAINGVMTDIDLMRVAPEDYSKDGFILLCADYEPNKMFYYLSIDAVADGYDNVRYMLQNGRMSGLWLDENYRGYNLPCTDVNINNVLLAAGSVSPNRLQKVNWPGTLGQIISPIPGSQLKKLVKTSAGFGRIQEFSVFLCSRKIEANLRFPTEQ